MAIICSSCHRENRDMAKYCKFCGTSIERGLRTPSGSSTGVGGSMGNGGYGDGMNSNFNSNFGAQSQSQNQSNSSHPSNNQGIAIPTPTALDKLICKDTLKAELEDILNKAQEVKARNEARGVNKRLELSFVITGPVGTGKTTVSEVIAKELHRRGIIPNSSIKVVSPTSGEKFLQDLASDPSKANCSVLVMDQSDRYVPDGEARGVIALDSLFELVRQWRGEPDKPVVILLGNERLADYFKNNPRPRSAINYFLTTNEITDEGLVEITSMIMMDKYNRTISEEGLKKLKRIYINDLRFPQYAKGVEGHNAERRAYYMDLKCPASQQVVTPEFIEGVEYKPKTYEQAMAEFDRFVGVDEIKESIHQIAVQLQEKRRSQGEGATIEIKDHFLFLGNPGTGKTTIAKLFAETLNAIGALPSGHLVEVFRKDLVSQYVGETPKLVTKYFDKAMGGVLFIDEAYSLKNGTSDSFGQEAIDTLLHLAENRRGKLVVVLAGYSKEMGEFLQSNSGLESRFNRTINFRDYNGKELAEIFRRMVKYSEEGYTLSEEADRRIEQFFDKMYLTRTRNFGNARQVRNVYSKAVASLTMRNSQNRGAEGVGNSDNVGTVSNGTNYDTRTGQLEETLVNANQNPNPNSSANVAATDKVIQYSDIEGEDAQPSSVEDILNSFDDLVGMESVKTQIKRIANTVRLDKMRAQTSGKVTQPNIHIIITGNPGTGKTVVAKRMGQIFKAMGVLPKGHVVERERKTLLDSYANSAGVNMNKAVDEAMGGVLFIDEAYNLIPMDNPGQKDPSGVAAVDALMTRMSNDAGKFVTIIAGYKTEIEEFVANANPGLERRFTHRIHIDDYSVDELVEIFLLNARKENFKLSPEAQELLYKKVQEMVTTKDKNFGNAGTIIKLFATTKERQAMRLGNYPIEELTPDQLYTFEKEDIPYDAPQKIDIKECMRQLDELVGLESVKRAIQDLAATLVIEQQRAQETGGRIKVNLDHYLFLGNPGTGKTTVARIMGNIFYSLGLLPSNKVVEVTSKDLIAQYVGQTAQKTQQMIQRSLGGIFFIDEAYSLNDGSSGFGKDAMPVLLTSLLDYKGKFVSIAAGYPREMKQWLDTNSGLESRYTRKIYFEDYTADELAQIFINMVRKEGFKMDERAEAQMRTYFQNLVYNKNKNFANAREVGNYFNRVKLNQGRRLRHKQDSGTFQREDLFQLCYEDMLMSNI